MTRGDETGGQEGRAQRPRGRHADQSQHDGASEGELRAGGATAGVAAGAAFGGVEGAAVAGGFEAGKSARDAHADGKESGGASKRGASAESGSESTRAGGKSSSSEKSAVGSKGSAASRVGAAASSTGGAAKSAMNVASADSKRGAASKGAGEAMKHSGNATMRAAGTVLSADGKMTDKAQQGAALAAGALAAGAMTYSGVGTPGAKVAAEVTTRAVGSQAAKRNWWKILLIFVLIIGGPSALATGMIVMIVPTIITSAAITYDTAGSTSAMCAPGEGGTAQLSGSGIEEQVWTYLTGQGWSEEQAAGIMGNIKRESQFNPFMAQDGAGTPVTSSGWGLVQWTAGRHIEIRDAVTAELGAHFYVSAPSYSAMPEGMSQDDIDKMTLFQLEYISDEMKGKEKAAGEALRGTSSVAEATRVFEEKYERAGVMAIEERITHAEGYFERFSGTAEPSGNTGEDAGSADLASTCGGAGMGGEPGSVNVTGEMGPVITAADETMGSPYVFGGGDGSGASDGARGEDAGEVGYDCSGVTSYAYKQGADVDLPRTAREQWAQLRSNEVQADELKPGDLIFYSYGRLASDIDHVAIYAGDGLMVEASRSNNEVVRVPARTSGEGFVGAGRVMDSTSGDDDTKGAPDGGDTA